ncbi:MAG: hypothetical protein DRJ08_01450, partial [Acidobacteria bacterium]
TKDLEPAPALTGVTATAAETNKQTAAKAANRQAPRPSPNAHLAIKQPSIRHLLITQILSQTAPKGQNQLNKTLPLPFSPFPPSSGTGVGGKK